MTPLLPEPRELRTARPEPMSGFGRAQFRATVEAFDDMAATVQRVTDVYTESKAALAKWLLSAFEPLLPPRTRRRLRKLRKLEAHYQAKLDRIPAWKRDA